MHYLAFPPQDCVTLLAGKRHLHTNSHKYRALYSTVKEIARRERISQIRLYVDKSYAAGIKTHQALGMRESHYLIFEAEAGKSMH